MWLIRRDTKLSAAIGMQSVSEFTRPANLPKYTNPPLDEVVVGVQFSTISQYSSILAKEIWDLFKEDFPNFREQPPLSPVFETFGGANPEPSMTFSFGAPPIKSRLWFVTADENRLIQFQDDRLLMNWRKRPNGQDYPHFESILSAFENCLVRVKEYFLENFGINMKINQTEVTYINFIPVDSFTETDQWISILQNAGELDFEKLTFNMQEIIRNSSEIPYARLFQEVSSASSESGDKKALRLAITIRGKPESENAQDSIEFLKMARIRIVNRFTEITTKAAHESWERIQ